MTESGQRVENLMALRDRVFEEMEEADRDFSRLRLAVERMESDLRLGFPTPEGYADLKGRQLPRAESRVVELYRELLKLEDKIRLTGA